MLSWLRIAALSLCALVILLVLAGASYQAIETRRDARRFPEGGQLVNVGGYRLMLNCTGSGSPTVILESGWSDVSIEWRTVQPEIAKFSRVCSYDRAGYGGSDPGPMPRTTLQIATELHTLLRKAGEMPPYVLVGSSFGGYNVRVFNGLYPDEVVGIVLADATSVVTSKPANGGHGKTGQRRWPGTRLFYSVESSACKFVFVRQLRGPHLST